MGTVYFSSILTFVATPQSSLPNLSLFPSEVVVDTKAFIVMTLYTKRLQCMFCALLLKSNNRSYRSFYINTSIFYVLNDYITVFQFI